jgi:hypothetical protein
MTAAEGLVAPEPAAAPAENSEFTALSLDRDSRVAPVPAEPGLHWA